MATAFSYLRFSRTEQRKGDSQRRQLDRSREWAKRKNIPLDESLNLRDLGVSAFRGKNVKQGALAVFLEAIETGRVKPGDFLILENLDRLSRDEVLTKSLPLVQGIIGAGVNIVTLTSDRVYSLETVREIGPLIQMLLELWLANEESRKKSERLSAAWGNKRKRIAEGKLTRVRPQWLRVIGKGSAISFEPNLERVEIVRRIFKMAADGRGPIAIVKALNGEKVPTFGEGKRKADFWRTSYVKKILGNRAVLGEFQPHQMKDGKRVPSGEPIPAYFPPVISEADFYAAQQGKSERKGTGGRIGERVSNLFSGLLKDARDGSSLVIINKGDGPALVSSAARAGAGQYISFPYAAFERALIVWGYDLKLADVLPRKATNIEAELAKATGRQAELNRRIGTIKKEIKDRETLAAELFDTLQELMADRDEAGATAERLKAQQSTPEADAVNDLRKLLTSLSKASDDERLALRLKLRQLLRRLVDDVVVLVVQVNKDRIALADIRLQSGERRQVTIYSDQRVTLPDGLAAQDVRRWSGWPARLKETRFNFTDDATLRMIDLEKQGHDRGAIAAELGVSISQVSRCLLRNGHRKRAKKPANSERLMTWHPAGNGWAKTHKGKRYFIGLGKLAAAYPKLVKAPTADGSWKAANEWWLKTIR